MVINMYSTESCGYCRLAKEWFNENNIEFNEILLDNKDAISKFIKECPGLKTVPQIIIDGELIDGGYKGLMENKEEILSLLI